MGYKVILTGPKLSHFTITLFLVDSFVRTLARSRHFYGVRPEGTHRSFQKPHIMFKAVGLASDRKYFSCLVSTPTLPSVRTIDARYAHRLILVNNFVRVAGKGGID